MIEHKKVAIVYDWIDKWGGVERLLLTLHELFPEAPLYTSYYDPKNAPWAKDIDVRTSFMQKLPSFIRKSRKLSLPLYPFAFESFNFSQYAIVISVSSSFAKGIVTLPDTKHINICLTPARFLWLYPELYVNSLTSQVSKPYINYLKKWDYSAAQRPDKILSISKTVQKRCKKYYDRGSTVLYPPFDIEYWSDIKSKKTQSHPEFISGSNNKMPKQVRHDKDEKYFLVVSRLEPYKKVDLVIETLNSKKNANLFIVGKGSQLAQLKNKASDNITFFHDIPDVKLAQLYSKAQALIFPAEEDFGLNSLEAQFFGCPVIAFNKGGAKETVIEGKTGIFFNSQTPQSLSQALAKFNKISYTLKQQVLKHGAKNVKKYSTENFKKQLNEILPAAV